jgi:hypothetical protein
MRLNERDAEAASDGRSAGETPRTPQLLRRQPDREPDDVELSKAIVCGGAHGLLAEKS